MKKCDVIIPIYNAYECLKPCIDSVLNNTDMKENRIILINDKSTDERVLPLLKEYSKKSNIILLENENNLGFVGTVNRGMKYSKNDVLLLNSDTEVTKNWLEKIKKCAYSNEMIATVTPLSNNATLASVPVSFKPNQIPEGYTLETMATLVEKCSFHNYPVIPTGHGFCLYIKREALDKVGYFDEESFGKGYGEENDFCFRCIDSGYYHVMCDDTYILHKESQSFTDSKIKLMEHSAKVLQKKFPMYTEQLTAWCSKNPIKYIGDNIIYNIGKENVSNRKNILYIIHDWNLDNLGGTTMHAYDLIKKLRNEYNFYVLTREADSFKLFCYYKNNEFSVTLESINQIGKLNYYNNAYSKMLSEIIENFSIDILHVHHMIGHFFDIKSIIKKYNIYSILSLHDLYSICPLITKINDNNVYCGKVISNDKCDKCLYNYLKLNYGTINTWKENWEEYLTYFDKVVAPSESTKEEIIATYKNAKIDVIEHGTDFNKIDSSLKIRKTDKYYDVAFVGAIGLHKGSVVIKNLLSQKKYGKIRFHLFGIIDDFNMKKNKNYINHGRYKRSQIQELLIKNNIKLVCLFSICPETYSYALSETISAGVPVLGFDIGALGERIKKDNLGWVLPHTSSYKEVQKKINWIFNNEDEYAKIINNINNYKLRTIDDMAKDYNMIYSKVKKSKYVPNDNYIKNIFKYNSYNQTVVYNNYAWVFDTLKWKLISKIKVPKVIKTIVKKVMSK